MSTLPPQKSGQRQELQADDFDNNTKLRKSLNDILSDVQLRLGDLESLAGLYSVPPFVIQTNKTSTAYGNAPFPVRVALPEGLTPAGIVLAGIERQERGATPATVAQDVKWQVTPGGGGFLIRHIPGLDLDSKYLLRLVVIRGR